MSSIARNTFVLAGGRTMGRLIAGVAALFVAGILGPERMGQLALPNLLIAAFMFMGLGIPDALIRDIPHAKAKNCSTAELDRIAQSALGVLAMLLVALYAVWNLVFWSTGLLVSESAMLWQLALFSAMLNLLFKYTYSLKTARGEFSVLSLSIFAMNAGRAALVLPLLFMVSEELQLFMPYTAFFSVFLLGNLLLLKREIRQIFRLPDWRIIRRLVKTGLPISFYSFGLLMLLQGDKLLLSRLLEIETLGLLELGIQLRDFLIVLPAALLAVLVPKLSQLAGNRQAAQELRDSILAQVMVTSRSAAVLMCLGVLNIPWFMNLVLHDYREGVMFYQLTVLGIAPLAMSFIYCSYLISVRRIFPVALALFVGVGIVLISDFRLWHSGGQLVHFGTVVLVVYGLFSLFVAGFTLRLLKQSHICAVLLRSWIPMLGAGALSGIFIGLNTAPSWGPLLVLNALVLTGALLLFRSTRS